MFYTKNTSTTNNKVMRYLRGILAIVIGTICLWSGIAQTSLMNKKPIDLGDRNYDWLDIEPEDHAKFTMSNCFGAFWEFTTNGHSSSKLYVYSNSGARLWDYEYFIGVKVNSSNYDQIEELCDQTERFVRTGAPINTSYEVDGRVRRMSEDEYDALKSNLLRAGYSEEETRQIILPYVIDLSSGGTFLLVVGGIAEVVGIALLAYTIVSDRKKKKQPETEGLRVFD